MQGQVIEYFYILKILGEGDIEFVEVLFVLYQTEPGQVIEVVDVSKDDVFFSGTPAEQITL